MMIAEIPIDWQSVVCQCSGGAMFNARVIDERNSLFLCTRCKRPDKVGLHRCTSCSSVFLKDFSHPRWLVQNPNCWPCLEADDSRATEILVGFKPRRHKRVAPTERKRYLLVGKQVATGSDGMPVTTEFVL